MNRQLGIFETATVLTDEFAPFNVVVAVALEGGLSASALRGALDRIQRRHPLLAVHIVKMEKKYFYEQEGTPEIPLETMPRKGPAHWQSICDTELNRAIDVSIGPLARCVLLDGGGEKAGHDLIVTFHHAIIDSACAQTLIGEILSDCGKPEAGRASIAPPSRPFLPPTEVTFPKAFNGIRARLRLPSFMLRQLGDEFRYRRWSRGARIPPVHNEGLNRTLCRDLSGKALEDLVRATRRRRVTLNAILNAAMLVAVQRCLYDGLQAPVRNFIFALLRPFLQPSPADEDLGSHVAMLRFTHLLASDQDVWKLARDINSRVRESARRGDNFLSLMLSSSLMRMILGQKKMRMGTTALAYTGLWTLPTKFEEIRICRLHAFVSNLVLGPEYTIQSRLFDGRLWWDIVFMESDMNREAAERVADTMLEILARAAIHPMENR